MRMLTRRFLDVDRGANALSAPDMGLGEFDEICAVLQSGAIERVISRLDMLFARTMVPLL